MIDSVTKQNAENAESRFGIPSDVYLQLSESFTNSPLFTRLMNENAQLKNKLSTSFAVGLIIGWLKQAGKDDEIEKIIANKL